MIAAIKAKLAAALALIKGWRTVAFGIVVSAVGAWDALAAAGFDITPFFPDKYRPMVLSVTGLLVVTLRCISSSKVGTK